MDTTLEENEVTQETITVEIRENEVPKSNSEAAIESPSDTQP